MLQYSVHVMLRPNAFKTLNLITPPINLDKSIVIEMLCVINKFPLTILVQNIEGWGWPDALHSNLKSINIYCILSPGPSFKIKAPLTSLWSRCAL